LATDCTALKRVNGSLRRLDMALSGKNRMIALAISGLVFHRNKPNIIPSTNCQTNRNPRAKADRFTKIPKNKQNEKKPTNLMKKAKRYSKSEKIIPISVQLEKLNPKIKDTTNKNTVEIPDNAITV